MGLPSMGPGSRNMNQPITYWAPAGVNNYNEFQFAAPVLIHGRWTRDSNLVTNIHGDEVKYNSLVLLDTDVVEEGYLAPGDFTSGPGYTINPNDGTVPAHQIHAFHTATDLRNMEKERRAYTG